jgi:CRISPR/Cas system CSM-associated protein Csm5 (group 7 of RAMP superfamily)
MTIKTYKLTLTTLGLVHIGNGNKARAKEYVLLDNGATIYFPDMGRLYLSLNDTQKQAFENYLMGNNQQGGNHQHGRNNNRNRNNNRGRDNDRDPKLGEWLNQQGITRTGDWGGYCLANGNAANAAGAAKAANTAKAAGAAGAQAQPEAVVDDRCQYIGEGGLRCRNHAVNGTKFCNTHAAHAGNEAAMVASNAGAANAEAEPNMAGRQIFIPENGPLQRLNDINSCIKDAWGKPYIPGSSVKGMLRTLYIVSRQNNVINTVNPYTPMNWDERERYQHGIRNPEDIIATNNDLPTDDKDIFQFLSVSDSAPLSTSDLILCKKIDRLNRDKHLPHNRGTTQESMPALDRECIRAGVKIEFKITCTDASLQQFLDNLEQAVQSYHNKTIASVKDKFDDWGANNVKHWGDSGIYIGGGTGFHTKTVAMTNIVRANILDWKFDQTGRWTRHTHGGGNFRPYNGPFAQPLEGSGLDEVYGWPSTFVDSVTGELQSSAPRVYKLTKIADQYYEMGKCAITIEETSCGGIN